MALKKKSKHVFVDNGIGVLAEQLETRSHTAVQQATTDTAARARENASHPGHGRVYIRHGRPHRASEPGAGPAPDTEKLLKSIEPVMDDPLHGRVIVGVDYGLILELGGKYVAPRPYLGPAAEQVRSDFLKAMRRIASR